MGIFKFKKKSNQPVFVIDTPPPFTSGGFHVGRAYGCVLSDVVARYKRMRGYNVLLPQGWDTQGLPTELAVQNRLGISPNQTKSFLHACKVWTFRNIEAMRSAMVRLGYSADWTFQYKTMDEDYHKRVQLALLRLFRQGRIYRSKHPVYWCPKCKTTLAQAELGYIRRKGILSYIKFEVENRNIEVATTRPELLHACVAVAVNPKDKRYGSIIGKKAVLPIYNRKVPIIADDFVNPEFGTGAVMVCTFGDENDVRVVLERKLSIIQALDEEGRIVNSKYFDGLPVEEARKAILRELDAKGFLSKVEELWHNVLAHTERSTCQTPIEFMLKEQWFIRILDLKGDIIKLANEIVWIPEHFRNRFVKWVESLSWDWIFSRQRKFGTPIPFWYCKECGAILPPKEEQLPVNPLRDKPPFEICPKCGSKNLVGASEVCDCWVDSSITPLVICNWPKKLENYPVDLRQQGSEIVRTWAFYTITQCYLQTRKIPFKKVLVNGMILGPDGKAISSSLGNVIYPEEAIEKFGADSLRQALLLARVGSDFPFKWKDIEYCWSFLQKMWNASRFAYRYMEKTTFSKKPKSLYFVDKWMLSRLQRLIVDFTNYMESFRFNLAVQEFQEFFWHLLCDDYIEMIKHRLNKPKRKWMKESAIYTLNHTLWNLIRLYAPITPHITEELYHKLFKKQENLESIHLASWPKPDEKLIDENSEACGELLRRIVRSVRKFKSKHRMALSEEISHLKILCNNKKVSWLLEKISDDIEAICKVKKASFSKKGSMDEKFEFQGCKIGLQFKI